MQNFRLRYRTAVDGINLAENRMFENLDEAVTYIRQRATEKGWIPVSAREEELEKKV